MRVRRLHTHSAAGRAGTLDDVGNVGALLMGPDGGFITGSDFLMDGGVTAAYWFGKPTFRPPLQARCKRRPNRPFTFLQRGRDGPGRNR